MTRTLNSGVSYQNRFGAIRYESSGDSMTPMALTQLHRNGEIWALTQEYFVHHAAGDIVAVGNVQLRLTEGLSSFVEVARDILGIDPPYTVEMGLIGLKSMRVTLPSPPNLYANRYSEPIHGDICRIRRVLNDTNLEGQGQIVETFLKKLYAAAAVDFG